MQKIFSPLFFTGAELDAIFNFLDLIEVENFVEHPFLSPNFFDIDDFSKILK